MKRKFTLIALIAVVGIIAMSTAYAAPESDSANRTAFSIDANPPMKIGELINLIKTQPAFKTYDTGALQWLQGLDSNYVVYTTDDGYIVMNTTDAAKIPDTVTTGVSVSTNITCKVLENKSLGSKLKNVLVVGDVEAVSGDLKNFKFGG